MGHIRVAYYTCNWNPHGREERRGNKKKIVKEIMAKMCPNLIKIINPQNQKVQQILSKKKY